MLAPLAALFGALALSAVSPVQANTMRGLGWATNNNFAKDIGSKPQISWYHHWEMGPVPQMPSDVPYVPMFWGTSKWSDWSSRVSEMDKKTPQYLMGFNEPDVSSQANMSPGDAASTWMQQIQPWSKKGTKLGSPAIAYDLDWMASFLSDIKNKGGHIDFMCIHWYGPWNGISDFKKFVESVHSRFGVDIWITELGITTASNPSQSQVKTFMMNAYSWMDSTGYVKRAAWFGSFESNQPPDGYATGKNALLSPGGGISDMGFWYSYTTQPNKRSPAARHHLLSRTDVNDAADDAADAVYCDETCKLRTASIEKWEKTLATRED